MSHNYLNKLRTQELISTIKGYLGNISTVLTGLANGDARDNTKAPLSHNQASNTINAMTDYAKASTSNAITTTDTLNQAIGKLEKGLDNKAPLTSSSTIDFVGEGLSLTKPGETNKAFKVVPFTYSGSGTGNRENQFFFHSPNLKGMRAYVRDTRITGDITCKSTSSGVADTIYTFRINHDMFHMGNNGYSESDNFFLFHTNCAGDSIGRAANSGAALSGSTLDLWYESAKLNGKKILTDDDINSWRDLQMKVRKNDMADIDISDQYVCSKGSGTITWDVISKNIDTPADPNRTNALTLRVDECLPDNLQFDAPEALYACSEVMPAGTYHYTVGGTSYQFTTTRAYPIGGQFVCTDNATLYTYLTPKDKNPQEALTVTQGNGGTDLGTLSDNVINGNLNTNLRRQYGSNNWKESAIRQWLNSDKPAGQWWSPQTAWDRPPAYASTMNGFMYDLDPEFRDVIGKTQVTTNYFDASTGTINGTYTTEDYFFLMSQSQVDSSYSGEGTKYTPYSDNASRIMYKGGSARAYWLRSPSLYSSYGMYSVETSGGVYSGYYARDSYGVAPACNII